MCGENAHFFFVGREAPRIFIFCFWLGQHLLIGSVVFLFFFVGLFSWWFGRYPGVNRVISFSSSY